LNYSVTIKLAKFIVKFILKIKILKKHEIMYHDNENRTLIDWINLRA
jgi:hypothetical protein